MPSLTEEMVRTAVHRAIDDVNRGLPDGGKIPVTGSVNVLSMLDSLGTLNLLLQIERQLADATGTEWDLTGSDVYERTLFHAPSLDDLVEGVFRALHADT